MITKQTIRQILDDNLPKPYVHFQRRDLIAELILEAVKKAESSDSSKVVGKKSDGSA